MGNYLYCNIHGILYAADGVCPRCVELHTCSCGASFAWEVGSDNKSCPRCQIAYYKISGAGVRQIVIKNVGIGHNVNVLVEG